MSETLPPHRRIGSALGSFVGVPFRTATYKNLAYLALAWPLGILYFVGVTVGLSLGTGLLVTLVGVPILVVTLYLTTVIAGIEASLARLLVDVDAPTPALLRDATDSAAEGSGSVGDESGFDAFVAWTRRLLTTPTTWTALVLVGLKFVFGLVSFVALVVLAVLTGTLLSAPLLLREPSLTVGVLRPEVGTGGIVGVTETGTAEVLWAVDSVPEAVGATVVGVLALLVGLHLLNGLARLGGLLTAALLDVGQPSEGAESTA